MFAVTERLLLRPGWPEDAGALARAIGDRQVAQMLARVPWPYTVAHAAEWLGSPHDPLRPRFLVCRRDTAALVGGIGLDGAGGAELGYWIVRDHWGRGYATEAGRAVLAIADRTFRLDEVRASHAIDNPASARVLAKLGFIAHGAPTQLPSLGRGGLLDVQPVQRSRPDRTPLRLAA